MRKLLKVVVLFILIGSSTFLSAQQLKIFNVNSNYIYNTWVFSVEESDSEVEVYRNEAYYLTKENDKSSKWTFTQYDDVFLNNYLKARKVFVPNKTRRDGICNRGGKHVYVPSQRIQGKWRINMINDELILKLNYFEAISGRPLKLKSTKEFRVVHLRRNKMVLRKLEKEI
ncbi:hypothetical protein [Aurantibacter sp.]|uniref:hypothetical protein n=1 Tax=Aurantibacter sp. TaxID=2807103 RepID=UPI0032672504